MYDSKREVWGRGDEREPLPNPGCLFRKEGTAPLALTSEMLLNRTIQSLERRQVPCQVQLECDIRNEVKREPRYPLINRVLGEGRLSRLLRCE
jgi:hypothetical protein